MNNEHPPTIPRGDFREFEPYPAWFWIVTFASMIALAFVFLGNSADPGWFKINPRLLIVLGMAWIAWIFGMPAVLSVKQTPERWRESLGGLSLPVIWLVVALLTILWPY